MANIIGSHKEKWLKANVHKCCPTMMFSIPEQEYSELTDPVVYLTLFEWGIVSYEIKNTTISNFKFCPYCGKNLIEIEER